MTDKVLKAILILLSCFNIIDGVSTQIALSGGAVEANPVINLLVGTPYFLILKLLLIPAVCILLWHTRRLWMQPFISRLLVFVTAAYAGVTVWHMWGQFLA